MIVTKRDGKTEEMQFDKIVKRIRKVMFDVDTSIDPHALAMKVIEGLFDGVTTSQIDEEIAQTSASMVTVHPDYAQLAANISVSNLHKNTSGDFLEKIVKMYDYINPKTEKHAPIISEDLLILVMNNSEKIQDKIDYRNDYNYDYFGFKTLEKSYLLKYDGQIIERPQDMLMRVSLGIHGDDLQSAFATYEMMSNKYFTHATPTLFNSGTPSPQMSSCFLIDMEDDSIDGIYNTLKTTAKISKGAGGIGLTAHKVRAKGSYIAGTNGTSNGIVPMLKVFNETARYVDQGGGKRKGSFAMYIEPWHADIFDFLELKKNHGKEEMRARDLFYALWICDEFMRRVKADEMWSLMCPNQCPNLDEVHGAEFDELYRKYESENRFIKQIPARELWDKIVVSQIETGTPYMLYKDSANAKSNQKNLGTIKSSNLCAEVIEYTSPKEVAVCNLASIALPMFVKTDDDGNKYFDHELLYKVAYQATFNLNRVIDKNYYPVWEAENSNKKHRPIGLGVQGLADMFLLMRFPFESDEAKQLNKDVHETIYFASLMCSNDLAQKDGAYQTFENSPLSKGVFQFNAWEIDENELKWDWDLLRRHILKYGVRNSLVTALMPTASTGQILGNNECFEPYTTNIYTRRTLSGEFIVVNRHLIKDLIDLGLWNNKMRQNLMRDNGSVQNLNVPTNIKLLYKTVWEMSMKNIIDMSADRGAFIDQSQSLNLFMAQPTENKVTSMHFYAWQKGLKTGMYYLRTKPAVDAKKFTLDPIKEEANESMNAGDFRAMIERSRNAAESGEDCLMCGS